jgi:hypothetical protein
MDSIRHPICRVPGRRLLPIAGLVALFAASKATLPSDATTQSNRAATLFVIPAVSPNTPLESGPVLR